MVPDIFSNLRRDAEVIVKVSSSEVKIDDDAVINFTDHLKIEDIKSNIHRVSYPLKFDTHSQELTFHCMHALLDFGSGYEDLLFESAADTILFGLIGLHLTRKDLSTGSLMTMSRSDISSYFGIDPMVTVPHESIPAFHIERPGPLSGYVDDLVRAFNETGEQLKELDEPDLGRFLLGALKGEGKPTVARIVTALSVAFASTFGGAFVSSPKPSHTINSAAAEKGSTTSISFAPHKKALALAGELYHRLRATFPEFNFADFNQAPGYATPSSISYLVNSGLVKVSDNDPTLASSSSPEKTAALYAASLLVMDRFASKLEGEVSALDLAFWLNEKGREEEKKMKEKGGQPAVGQEDQQQQKVAESQSEKGGLSYCKILPPRNQMVM